jgi:hypothetical protein
VRDGTLVGPRRSIRTTRRQRVIDVDHREDARGERDILAGGAAWVTGAVPAFVMTAGNRQSGLKVLDLLEHRSGIFRMAPHDRPLVVPERNEQANEALDTLVQLYEAAQRQACTPVCSIL